MSSFFKNVFGWLFKLTEPAKLRQHFISEDGLQLIKDFEGYRADAYKCSAGVWTIGYGTTVYPNGNKIQSEDRVTEAQAESYLRYDVDKFEKIIRRVVQVTLNQSQFDALVSWTYNLGEGNLQRSTLLKVLNEGKYHEVPAQILRWNRAGGKVLKGLTRRREAEAALFRGDV